MRISDPTLAQKALTALRTRRAAKRCESDPATESWLHGDDPMLWSRASERGALGQVADEETQRDGALRRATAMAMRLLAGSR